MNKNSHNHSAMKIIDFRNGKYQGFVNHHQKHGIGILIDDDLHVYCTEWNQDQINGRSFLWLNDHYAYGSWKNNQPHGHNLYKNRQSILISNYDQGNHVGNVLAVPNSFSSMAIFQGSQVHNKHSGQVQLKAFQNLYNSTLSSDMIIYFANKNQIKISEKDYNILAYLQQIAESYRDHLQFIKTGHFYYFGFKHGLGFNFTFSGRQNQTIQMITIGSHENGRLSDFGRKYYDNKSIQQGNFLTKETITYNRFTQRPKQKCNHIFTKNHKKSLNFVNEYFQFKKTIFHKLDEFLKGKCQRAIQECIDQQYMQKRLQTKNVSPAKREFNRESRQEFQRSKDLKKNRSQSTLLKSKSGTKLTKQASKELLYQKALYALQPQKSLEDNVHQKSHNHSHQNYHNHFDNKRVNTQMSYKLLTHCQRCISRQNKFEESNRKKQKQLSREKGQAVLEHNIRSNKYKGKKSPIRQKSREKSFKKIENDRVMKDLKYLVEYKASDAQQNSRSQKINQKIRCQSGPMNRAKEQKNVEWTVQNQQTKQEMRVQNEKKIRQQILSRQLKREIVVQHHKRELMMMNQYEYQSIPYYDVPLPISQHSPNKILQQLESYYRQPSNPRIDHLDTLNNRSPDRTNKAYQNITNHPSSLLSASNNQMQSIENRREQLLRQYKYLNESHLSPYSKQETQQLNRSSNGQNTIMNLLQSSRKKEERPMVKKGKEEQFNKKYRNYLQESNRQQARRDRYEYYYD